MTPGFPRSVTASATLLCILLLPGFAPAVGSEANAPGGLLTLEEAVRLALERFPSLGISRAEAAAARAAAEEARAEALPTASLAASAIRYEEPMVVTPIHGFSPDSIPEFDRTLFQGGLQVRHVLWDGGARRARIDAAFSRADVETSALLAEEQEIARLTVEIFLRVFGLRRTLDAHEERLEALRAEERRVARVLEVGRAAPVDLQRIRAAVAAARADRVRLAGRLDTGERDLARLVGLPPEHTRSERLVPVAAPPPDLPAREELLTRALAASPEVASMLHALEAAEAREALAVALRKPSLGLEGNVQELGSAAGDFTTEWNGGVRITLPLFDASLRRRHARAEAETLAARERLRLQRDRVAAALDHALAALDEALARAESLGEAVLQYRDVARVELLRLETGVGVEADYLAAEADLLAARASRVQAVHASLDARTELARILGELGLAWIERTFHPADPEGRPLLEESP